MKEKTQKAPLEPIDDKYTILLSMIEYPEHNPVEDRITTIIDGEEVLIRIPNIS